MRAFSLVKQIELDKINKNNIKNLSPERQIQAIRMWADQNIKKDGPMGTQDSNEEMQKFIEDAAKHLQLDTRGPSFQSALKKQKGWGEEWKSKIRNKMGVVVDLDADAELRDTTLQGVLKKIVEDRGGGHHGNTVLGGNNGNHLHWRSGSLRIFGTYNPNGTLTLIGTGRHTGTSNSNYKVNLITGGSTTAATG